MRRREDQEAKLTDDRFQAMLTTICEQDIRNDGWMCSYSIHSVMGTTVLHPPPTRQDETCLTLLEPAALTTT